MMMALRPYQRAAIDAIYGYFARKSGHPVVAIPTAGGKSLVMASFIREVLEQWPDQRILIVTHVRELIAQGREVTMVLGGRSEAQIYPAAHLPSEVELVVATEDGSLGETGRVTAPFERLLSWCDQAFACGPQPMFEALYGIARDSGTNRPVQGLLEARMACGLGICYSCAVFPRKGGVRLVCSDGPMFDLRDLYA